MDLRNRVAAIHEAGHAWASVCTRLAFERAAIFPGGENQYAGAVYFLPRARRLFVGPETIRKRLFMLMAGEAAERVFFEASEETFQFSSSGDRELAREELQTFMRLNDDVRIEAEIGKSLARALTWARRPHNAHAISLMADVLEERHTITRKEIFAEIPSYLFPFHIAPPLRASMKSPNAFHAN